MFEIMAGKRPKKPEAVRDNRLWEVIESCWNQEPEKRPFAFQLLEFFRTS